MRFFLLIIAAITLEILLPTKVATCLTTQPDLFDYSSIEFRQEQYGLSIRMTQPSFFISKKTPHQDAHVEITFWVKRKLIKRILSIRELKNIRFLSNLMKHDPEHAHIGLPISGESMSPSTLRHVLIKKNQDHEFELFASFKIRDIHNNLIHYQVNLSDIELKDFYISELSLNPNPPIYYVYDKTKTVPVYLLGFLPLSKEPIVIHSSDVNSQGETHRNVQLFKLQDFRMLRKTTKDLKAFQNQKLSDRYHWDVNDHDDDPLNIFEQKLFNEMTAIHVKALSENLNLIHKNGDFKAIEVDGPGYHGGSRHLYFNTTGTGAIVTSPFRQTLLAKSVELSPFIHDKQYDPDLFRIPEQQSITLKKILSRKKVNGRSVVKILTDKGIQFADIVRTVLTLPKHFDENYNFLDHIHFTLSYNDRGFYSEVVVNAKKLLADTPNMFSDVIPTDLGVIIDNKITPVIQIMEGENEHQGFVLVVTKESFDEYTNKNINLYWVPYLSLIKFRDQAYDFLSNLDDSQQTLSIKRSSHDSIFDLKEKALIYLEQSKKIKKLAEFRKKAPINISPSYWKTVMNCQKSFSH